MSWLAHFCVTHIRDLAIAGLSMAVLVVLGLCVAGSGRAHRPAKFSMRADESGALAEEMVLIFPLFLLFLGMTIQLILMLNARLVVNYAAFVAGRSASVWIPRKTAEEAANQIKVEGQEPSSICLIGSVLGGASGGPTEKLDRIRGAAALACAPVSPNYVSFCGRLIPGGTSVSGPVIGWANSMTSRLPGVGQAAAGLGIRWLYARDYTRVWFNDTEDSRVMSFPEKGDVKVTVEHDFYMSVPFLGRFLGKPYKLFGFSRSLWYVPIRESYVFRNEGEAVAPGW